MPQKQYDDPFHVELRRRVAESRKRKREKDEKRSGSD
jgi:hypothetical protein